MDLLTTQCKAIVKQTGRRCSCIAANPADYADKSLDFELCPRHIWGWARGAFETVSTHERQVMPNAGSIQPRPELAVAGAASAQTRYLAARESLLLCRRFFPWRVA
jgi:hypothetical protein